MVWSPQQLVSIAAQGQSQPPGQFSYSDTNYAILGIIAQAVTGQPIGSLITSQVIQPLHLNNTSYPTTRAIPPPATTGYVGGPGGQLVATPIYDPSATDGSGAMISTLGDLQVWAKALATGSLLSPATQQQRLQLGPTGLTFSPLPGTTASAGIAVQYGLGVMGYGGMLGHNGLGDGYNAEMFYLPAKNATVVVLLNGLGTFTGPGGQESLGDGAVVSIAQIALSGAVATSPAPSTAPSQRRAF
jgi:D-alanyl-D-alanine carboxypeptidase